MNEINGINGTNEINENYDINDFFVNNVEKQESKIPVQEENIIPMPTSASNEIPVPVSSDDITKDNVENIDSLSDDEFQELLHNLVLSVDENGHTPCSILACIEKIHNVTPDTTLEDVVDENRELIDEVELEYCSVDIFSMDNEFANVVLTFDNPNDAYLNELNLFLNRYRLMQEHYATHPDIEPGTIVMFTISFMPYQMEAKALLTCSFPVMYFKTMNDVGATTNMHMLFHGDNVGYHRINISEEEMIEMKADAMRENEQRPNSMFSE